MKRIKLKVETREETGKEASKKLRNSGYVPGILYSPHDKNNIMLKIPEKDLHLFLADKKHAHGIISLQIKDKEKKNKSRLAFVKDFQYDSLKKRINHFDFYGVTMKEKITLEIPVVIEGEPVGIKEGGILEVSLREVEIECLPVDAPETITIDVSQLGFNDSISISELTLPKGVKRIDDSDCTISSMFALTRL